MSTPISMPKGYKALGAFPIDASTLFSSLSALQAHAAGTTSYAGQVCSVVENGVVTVYKVNSDKSLTPIDTTSAQVNADWGATTGVAQIFNKPGNFGPATSSANGTAGFVPAPAAGDDTKFLKGDGNWAAVSSGAPLTDTTAPANLAATAAVGTSEEAARANHVHAFPTASELGIWKSVSINSATTNIPTGRYVYAAPTADFIAASNPATVNLPTGTGVADGDVFVIEYKDDATPFVEVNVNQSGSTLLTIDTSGGVYFFRYLRGWKLEEARHNIPREWVDAGETIASGGSVSLPETLIGKWTNINATGTGTLTVTLPTLLPSVDTAPLTSTEISRLGARIGISFAVYAQNGTQYNRKAITVRVPTAIAGVFTTVLSLPAVSNGDFSELRRQIHYVFRVDADTGSWVLNEQEQADWSQTDNTQPDFIKNKPTIPSAPTIFAGSNGTIAGTAGLVPLPAATDNTKFLKGDGTWTLPSPADIGAASSSDLDQLFALNLALS